MVELIKKNIHMNRWKNNVATQITLDDDFIVPDTMDDMEQVILDTGDIQIENVKNQGEKVSIKGKLSFHVLYRKEAGGMQTLAGAIPFEEQINVPGLEDRDYVSVIWELDDLNAGIINSRKLSMKAIISLDVRVETIHDADAAVDIKSNTIGEENIQVESLKRNVDIAAIAVRRKDTHRIKEDISLPGNKPNINQILWSEMKLRGISTKPLDGTVHVEGELMVFVIYSGEGEGVPIQWLEESIPFSGEVELPEATEGMVPFITVRLLHKEIEEKPDYDGEMREIEIDAVLELDMKLYREEQIELLSDLYSTNRELVLQTGEVCFDRLLAKNTGKCKVAEKVKLENSDKILQICHSEGTVKLDEIEAKQDALHVDGILEVRLLYLTDDDSEPVKSTVEVVPFHYMVEAKGINQDSLYQMSTGIEQLTAVMMGGDTIEVKAILTLDLFVLQPVCQQVITNVVVEPMDLNRLQQLPGVVGYIVQQGDTLWEIAKKFHTTVENIMVTNGLTDSMIYPGDQLILVKEIAN